MEHPLDNPAWNALNSGNQNLSVGNDKARYYHPDISPFAGIEGHVSDNLKVLYELSPAESVFGLVNMINPIPERWNVINRVPCFQMVCENPVREASKNIDLVPLTTEHIPQMLALTKLTNPGPFLQRTIEFGHYLGIFDGDKLVAMAGQRMNPLPFAEISAVCTHPDYLGRGYAAQLLLSHVHRIREAGQTPFLHVLNTNERAVKLYDSIGFKIRKELEIVIIKKH